MKIQTSNPNKTNICQKLMFEGLNGAHRSWWASQGSPGLSSSCPGSGVGTGARHLYMCIQIPALSLSPPQQGAWCWQCSLPICQEMRAHSTVCSAAGGGHLGWASQPAWKTAWAPHSGPHTSVYKKEPDVVWKEGQNSVSSTLAPQRGPLTSGESVVATAAVSSQRLPLRALAAL